MSVDCPRVNCADGLHSSVHSSPCCDPAHFTPRVGFPRPADRALLLAGSLRSVWKHSTSCVLSVIGGTSVDHHNLVAAGGGPAAPARPILRDRKGFVYEPAIGPRLKVLLFIIFGGVAVLGATGVYLLSISFLEWLRS